MIPANCRAAIAEARRLVRGLAAAPDPRRRAATVLARLRLETGWDVGAQRALDEAEAWLHEYPPVNVLPLRLKQLLRELE